MRSESPDNVANLIAKPIEEYAPEPRYVSKYRSSVIRESKRGKSAHKTLGVPSVDLGAPSQFLKKRSGSVPKRPSVRHEHYRRPDYQRNLPEWQPIKAADKDKRPTRTSVDFEKRNVQEAKNLRPSEGRMYYVDDRHGTLQPLELSGMYPHYTNRKSNGVPPGRVSKTHERQSARRSSPRRETRGESKSKGDKKYEEDKRKDRRISPARRAKESFFHKESEKRKSKEHKDKAKDRREKSKERKDRAKDGKEKSGRGTSPRTKEEIHKSRKKSMRPRAEGETEADGGAKVNGEDEGSDGDSPSEEGARDSREPTIEDDSRTESKTNDEEEQEEDEEDEEEEVEGTRSRSTSVRTKKKEEALTARTVEYQQPRCRYVTEDERADLLYGMKKKWDEMMRQFQGLPFLTDTQPKAKRKSRMEKDLLQLEKDIETIERHPYIYVYSDAEE